MNSTNVPSKRDNPAVIIGKTIPTDKELEMPPKTAKWGVSEKEVRSAEQEGEIVISQVGKSKIREDGTLEMQDGKTISMVNPKAYQVLMADRKKKEVMKEEASRKKEVMKEEASRKKEVQSGIEIG